MLPNTDFLDEITVVSNTHQIIQPDLQFIFRLVTQQTGTPPTQDLDTPTSSPEQLISHRNAVRVAQEEFSTQLVAYQPDDILAMTHSPQQTAITSTTIFTQSSTDDSTESTDASPDGYSGLNDTDYLTPSCSYAVVDQTNSPSKQTPSSDESDVTSRNSSSTDSHITTRQSGRDTNTFRCRLCGVVEKNKRSYRYHLSHNHGVGLSYQPISKRQYQCTECDFITDRSDSLYRHRRTHMTPEQREQLMTHHCHLCDYKTFRSDHLKKHIKKHDKDASSPNKKKKGE